MGWVNVSGKIRIDVFLGEELVGRNERIFDMDNTNALTAITAKLTTDTGALIAAAATGSGGGGTSVQPAIDAATAALTALDGQVLAGTPGVGTGPAPGAPSLTGIAPASAAAGSTTPVTLTGVGFTGATAINGSTALSFDSTQVVSDTQITVNVTVAAGTAPGAQQISVTGPNGTSNVAPFQTT